MAYTQAERDILEKLRSIEEAIKIGQENRLLAGTELGGAEREELGIVIPTDTYLGKYFLQVAAKHHHMMLAVAHSNTTVKLWDKFTEPQRRHIRQMTAVLNSITNFAYNAIKPKTIWPPTRWATKPSFKAT